MVRYREQHAEVVSGMRSGNRDCDCNQYARRTDGHSDEHTNRHADKHADANTNRYTRWWSDKHTRGVWMLAGAAQRLEYV